MVHVIISTFVLLFCCAALWKVFGGGVVPLWLFCCTFRCRKMSSLGVVIFWLHITILQMSRVGIVILWLLWKVSGVRVTILFFIATVFLFVFIQRVTVMLTRVILSACCSSLVLWLISVVSC